MSGACHGAAAQAAALPAAQRFDGGFRAVAPIVSYGAFRLRAVGGAPLQKSALYRSCELTEVSVWDAKVLTGHFGIRAIYDLRTPWEVSARPEPSIPDVDTMTVAPCGQRRKKDASRRLVAGVIGEYGEPGERMKANYRRYATGYSSIGDALRSISSQRRAALVHCVNGKDRTGVLCAAALRIAGWGMADIMDDYLLANRVNARFIMREEQRLSAGMTPYEHDILMSFLEARPEYLLAFFDEAERAYGSFAAYVERGLRLSPAQQAYYRDVLG